MGHAARRERVHAWLVVPKDLRRVARVRALADFLTETIRGIEDLGGGPDVVP